MARANKKFFKKYLKTIQHSRGYPKQAKELIKAAPIQVLKLLGNSAIIASQGSIYLTPQQKKQFRIHKKIFEILTNKSIGFEKKRKFLIQKGGFNFLPLLLSTVVPLVGDLLFRAVSNSKS